MHKNSRPPIVSRPGLILLGPGMEPVACNAEAIQILAYPAKTGTVKKIARLLAEKLPAALMKPTPGTMNADIGDFASGQRRYTCTRYVLDMHGQSPAMTIAIVIDRASSPDIALFQLCREFNLTPRESEAVAYLLQGLTSKEIAQQMNISPNTVKAFLRLVMTKTGVSTRAGLIGKIAGVRPHANGASGGNGRT